jgi:UDP-glucose 4-epimerase
VYTEAHTAVVFSSGDKVVVTGGAGFIGSHLVDRLLDDGCLQVVVLDNFTRGRLDNLAQHRADPRLRLLDGDVRDSSVVARAIRGADIVFHLAAQSTVMGAVEDPEYSFATNVTGTFNVLRAASTAAVRRLVFASSREVYGDPVELPVGESHPLLAINAYGASKVAAEAYCRAFRRSTGLQSVVLRLANVYGPRDSGRVIPVWLSQASAGCDLDVYGGKQIIDFVWIGVVIESLMRAAASTDPMPPVNVGSGTGTRIVDLARRIIRCSPGRSQVRLQQARPSDVTRYVADITRLREILYVEPPADPLLHLEALQLSAAPSGG